MGLLYEQTENCNANLTLYDVEQGGWEHEAKGFEFNLNHTLKELVRAERKDFYNPYIVRDELAPDAMQFALRIARWAGIKSKGTSPSVHIDEAAEEKAANMRISSHRIAAYSLGEIWLADYTHRLEHKSERATAIAQKVSSLSKVSQALMLFAEGSSIEFEFNLEPVFNQRLDSLRERFGIGQPE